MLYLALEHGWWLAAALCIGLVIGAIGSSGPGEPPGRGLVVAALIWAAAAAAVWSRTLNGDVAMLVETALLYTAVYALGCLLGGGVGAAMRRAWAPAPASGGDTEHPTALKAARD